MTSAGDRLEFRSPREVAETFIHAVLWAEHTVIWKLLSVDGRNVALSIAQQNGMDRVVASRIGEGVANPVEFDDFLQQLLHGLRRDLRGVDIDELRVASVAIDEANRSATVGLEVPSLLPGSEAWVAGELILQDNGDGGDERWLIDRLIPRVAGP